ncbi:MFS transporter [Rubrolithibacter danxiaensis]|uniref:MFS transporter n=1 Tax=Rubrolithibacter danxiaensis TaxID=3390805 RepID=UPI003BF87EE0
MILRRTEVLFMAVCTAFIVANIYYCQPLIILIAKEFHIQEDVAGKINYLTQAGYASGLLFLVPLGDMFERKKQILICTALTIAALLLAASSSSFLILEIASFLIGFSSIVPQLILPLAAHLTSDEKRGQTVGTIMGGLLIGILLSRTLSGAIAHWLGWRSVFYIASVICLLILIIIAAAFPKSKPEYKGSYGQLMASLKTLIRTQPLLRETSLINVLSFAVFSAFWSIMVLLLANSPFEYSSDQIGLFGLAGVAGAFAAPLIGKLSHSKEPRAVVRIGLFLQLISFVLMYFVNYSVLILILAIIILDIAQQSVHVTNQTRIYSRLPESRNRLNTVFMTASFIGAALGSAAGLALWNLGKWHGTVTGCIVLIVVNLILFTILKRKN